METPILVCVCRWFSGWSPLGRNRLTGLEFALGYDPFENNSDKSLLAPGFGWCLSVFVLPKAVAVGLRRSDD
jgi:hypothetical protein